MKSITIDKKNLYFCKKIVQIKRDNKDIDNVNLNLMEAGKEVKRIGEQIREKSEYVKKMNVN